MMFLDALNVPRVGRRPESFCHTWDAQTAVKMLAKTGHRFVEFLSEGGQGKMYLDRDVYVGTTPPVQETVDMHAALVRDKVQQILDRLQSGLDTHVRLSVHVATRHGFCAKRSRYKLSFRPFVQGMRIRRTDIPKVIVWAGQEDFWDMSVYKGNEQLLAAINGCKGQGDLRVLRTSGQFTELLPYMAQHWEPTWPFLDLPSNYVVKQIPLLQQPEAEPEFIRHLLSCLSTVTADDRNKWIKIGMVLKREGPGYYADWLTFSRRGSKFKGERDCLKTWTSLPTAGACTLGTLCFYAREDDDVAYGLATGKRGKRI